MAFTYELQHPTDTSAHLVVTKWTTDGTGDANFKTVSLWVDPNLADLQGTPLTATLRSHKQPPSTPLH